MTVRAVLLAFVVAASIASARAGISNASCARQRVCPGNPRVCGLFYPCPYPKLITAKLDVVQCDRCGVYTDPAVTPAKTCDFNFGRCLPNTIQEGKRCTGRQDRSCGGALKCTAVKTEPSVFRCCRTACPPGLCGGFNTMLFYEGDPCQRKLLCPGICPQNQTAIPKRSP